MENYMDNIKSMISDTRKKLGLTQEQLADQLGISYQAVSKWENGVACPDIMTLPRLATIFDMSIDALFGIENEVKMEVAPLKAEETEPEAFLEIKSSEEESFNNKKDIQLPWDDDGVLHAVAFLGHTLLSKEDQRHGECSVNIEGKVLNVHSNISVSCDEVAGYIIAGTSIECDAVGGNATSGTSIECDDVGGDVIAGTHIACDAIGGNASAGTGIECDDVGGDVSAGGNVSCENVGGNVSAGGSVNCDDVAMNVNAGVAVNCDDIGGSVSYNK